MAGSALSLTRPPRMPWAGRETGFCAKGWSRSHQSAHPRPLMRGLGKGAGWQGEGLGACRKGTSLSPGTLPRPTHPIAHTRGCGIPLESLRGDLLPGRSLDRSCPRGRDVPTKSCPSFSFRKPRLASYLAVCKEDPDSSFSSHHPVPSVRPRAWARRAGYHTGVRAGPVSSLHTPRCGRGQMQGQGPPSLRTRLGPNES